MPVPHREAEAVPRCCPHNADADCLALANLRLRLRCRQCAALDLELEHIAGLDPVADSLVRLPADTAAVAVAYLDHPVGETARPKRLDVREARRMPVPHREAEAIPR